MNEKYAEGLISKLRSSGNDIAWLAGSFPSELIEIQADGEWSARDLLAHLRDVEYGIG